MNSAPNSDSKQCPESKLSWVHRVHTQRTLAASALRPGHSHNVRWALCRGRAQPCRRHPPAVSLRARARWHAVSQRLGLPCRSLPACNTKIVSRHRAPAPCAPRALQCMSQLLASYRGALLRRIAALLRCIATQRSPPSATIQNFVSRPSASQAVRALPAVSWRTTASHYAPLRATASPCAPVRCILSLVS